MMVDIGGRSLHLDASGSPSTAPPAVILEAGLASTSLSWATVQPLITEFARVASYDRSGLGASGDAVAPATALTAAHELNLLLANAAWPGPYILVGHSLGGLIARIFQQLYPERVAGLVLVDPVARAEWGHPDARHRHMLAHAVSLSRRGAYLARIGVVGFALRKLTSGSRRVPGLLARFFAGPAAGVANRLVGEVRKIPSDLWPIIAANWSEERSFRTMADYLQNLPLSCGQLDESRTLGDLPVSVLSAANASPASLDEHRREALLSTRGEHLTIPGTNHWINLDAPAAIAAAVERMYRLLQS